MTQTDNMNIIRIDLDLQLHEEEILFLSFLNIIFFVASIYW